MNDLKTGKPSMLKEINRNIIVKLIIKNSEMSRSELSKVTGLALPSVMRLVDGLIEDGLLVEMGKGESSGGRRPNLVGMNKEFMYIIGVEIAIKATVILSDITGEVKDSWESEEMINLTPTELLNQIYHQINKLIKDNKLTEEQIAGIGIGTPGTNFKYQRDVAHSISKGWETIDVKSWFESKTDIDIYVDNVARTRTLGELWFGHGKKIRDFIYVFVDQGVGCGIVKNSQIVKGDRDVAGELGHSIIEFDGRPCYCGNNGCIEMYVSAGALTNEVNKKGYEFTHFTEMVETFNYQSSKIFEYASKILAAGIGNLINLLNPQAIILGGIVPKKSEVFRMETIKHIDENIFSNFARPTEVLVGAVAQDGLGSIALVINNKFQSIEIT